MSKRENPWAILRSRPNITLVWDESAERGGGALWESNIFGQDTITIDPRLGRRRRAEALMHELIHSERRVAYPVASQATMEREEVIVRRETARRLIPPDELADFLQERSAAGAVTVEMVADEFDVTEETATLAMWLHGQGEQRSAQW